MCAAALGLQQALRDEGIEIDLVVGCSGGSLYAAAAALSWTIDETIDLTMRLWTRDTTSRPRRMALLRAAFPRLFGFSSDFSFRDDSLLNSRLQAAFGARTFATPTSPCTSRRPTSTTAARWCCRRVCSGKRCAQASRSRSFSHPERSGTAS